MPKEIVELNIRESRALSLIKIEFGKLMAGETVISPIRVRLEDVDGFHIDLDSLRQAAQNLGVYFSETPDSQNEGAVLLRPLRPPKNESQTRPNTRRDKKRRTSPSFLGDIFGDFFP
jgi:hypothetical protein